MGQRPSICLRGDLEGATYVAGLQPDWEPLPRTSSGRVKTASKLPRTPSDTAKSCSKLPRTPSDAAKASGQQAAAAVKAVVKQKQFSKRRQKPAGRQLLQSEVEVLKKRASLGSDSGNRDDGNNEEPDAAAEELKASVDRTAKLAAELSQRLAKMGSAEDRARTKDTRRRQSAPPRHVAVDSDDEGCECVKGSGGADAPAAHHGADIHTLAPPAGIPIPETARSLEPTQKQLDKSPAKAKLQEHSPPTIDVLEQQRAEQELRLEPQSKTVAWKIGEACSKLTPVKELDGDLSTTPRNSEGAAAWDHPMSCKERKARAKKLSAIENAALNELIARDRRKSL